MVGVMLVAAVCLWVAAVGFGISASRQSASIRRGRHRLLAYILAGSGFCVVSVASAWLQWTLPIYESEGTIQSAQVHSEGKGHRTDLMMQTTSGEELALQAGGDSQYFHSGEHVKVSFQRYRIIKAHFLSPSGNEEGVFNSTDSWAPYGMFSLGLFVIWAGFRKTRRDPEGFERA